MNRREFLELGAAAVTSLFSLGRAWSVEAEPSRPNVLLILTDDQPYYTLRYMGGVRKRLAAQGLRFANGYVATPICGPARGTLLTGRWSHNTGLTTTTNAYQRIKASGLERDTVARRLKAAGYDTGLFGKYTNGYDELRVPPGWDRWFAMLEPFNRPAAFTFNSNKSKITFDRSRDNETDVIRSRAEAFVRNRGAVRPWFAYVCPHAPHGPYYPAPDHEDEFKHIRPREDIPSYNEADISDKPAVLRRAPITDDQVNSFRQKFQGKLREIQEVDDLVARLVTALSETGQLDRTLIIFATDNGDLFGEHGQGKKNIAYEEASRTPLVVRGPGVVRGQVSDALVSHVDFAPTILELAGADTSGLDGRSMTPLFSGSVPSDWRRYLLVEALGRGWNLVRDSRYVYIEWESGETEFYDMVNDPYQLDGTVFGAEEEAALEVLRPRLGALKACAGDSCRAAEAS